MGDVTQAHPGEQPKNEENRYDFIWVLDDVCFTFLLVLDPLGFSANGQLVASVRRSVAWDQEQIIYVIANLGIPWQDSIYEYVNGCGSKPARMVP